MMILLEPIIPRVSDICILMPRKKKSIDDKNVISRYIPGVDDNDTLPLLQTKSNKINDVGNHNTQDLIHAPLSM